MFNTLEKKQLPEKEKIILKLLLQKPFMQKDLAIAVGISGAGLLYHLNLLEDERLVNKKTLASVGNVSLNEISLNPNSIQRIRKILELKSGKYTLITGFGKDSSIGISSLIPSQATRLLQKEGYNISRIVAFCTPDSNIENAKKFGQIDRIIVHKYEDFRDDTSVLMQSLEETIQSEQKSADLLLDLTPLTKLLTIRLLEFSHKYKIPSFYLGKNKQKDDFILWVNQPNI